jgi:hypothetical protein
MQARDLSICEKLPHTFVLQRFQMTEKKIGLLSAACPLLRPNAICVRNARCTPMRCDKLISVLVQEQIVAYHMLVPGLQPAHQNVAPMDG